MRFAATVPGESVTDWQVGVGVQVGADRVALAGLATWRVSGLAQGQRISEEARFATLTMEAILFPGKGSGMCHSQNNLTVHFQLNTFLYFH